MIEIGCNQSVCVMMRLLDPKFEVPELCWSFGLSRVILCKRECTESCGYLYTF